MGIDLETSEVLLRAFPGIPKKEAESLAASGESCYYAPETVLCQEGAIEHSFYIILEGEVEVTKLGEDGLRRQLTTLLPGDFFGEMALIHDSPRAATVSTITPAVIFEIHKEAFDRLLQRSSAVSLAMVRHVSRRLRENDEMAIEDLRVKARELANAYQQLAELDLAQREFLSRVAQELVAPLKVSTSFLNAVQSGIIPKDALQSALESISGNLRETVSLVNNILYLQEMDLIMLDFKPVDVGAMIASIVEKQRLRLEHHKVGINLTLAADLPVALADAKSLEQGLLAVLDNAIKFSPEGSEIRIEVCRDGENIRLIIRDQGIGIPQNALPYIFDRYYKVNREEAQMFPAMGLGLSFARKVIEQHAGTITVESELGMGSVFTVTLKSAS